ncbi:F11F12.2-like protein [Hibiscus syriacus]|uniref:F11F12.2-like protein n=1 Tax=Hibiscus syriacus TaxID=106335 RepID=A0A6A2XC99_HIBSY|nr:uncharacterized protein LOC120190555 [Hibiscus syriacus]KAE8659756.1 F11F12.2-like protein [Hibiscus syriacus]
MGNCIRREKSFLADDEHWGSLESTRMDGDTDGEMNITEKEKEKLVCGKRDAKTREVKIIISKAELEHLMQKVDVQGLTLEQVLLARMVKSGGDVFVFDQPRSWKPVLQSIPEVN